MKTENLNKQVVKYIVMEKRILKRIKKGVPWKLNTESEVTIEQAQLNRVKEAKRKWSIY